jgi:hypothetical protein
MRDTKERKAEVCMSRIIYIVNLLACYLETVNFQFSLDSIVTSFCHIGNLGSVMTTCTVKGSISCNVPYAVQTQRKAVQPSANPDVLTTFKKISVLLSVTRCCLTAGYRRCC